MKMSNGSVSACFPFIEWKNLAVIKTFLISQSMNTVGRLPKQYFIKLLEILCYPKHLRVIKRMFQYINYRSFILSFLYCDM
jgi:hypothetical protein